MSFRSLIRSFKLNRYITIPVTIATRIHLFPYRTQKLSSFTPDVVGFFRGGCKGTTVALVVANA